MATTSIANAQAAMARFWPFLGPAFLVSVGYMDPGNWATAIEGGSRFGYDLVWVLVVSNVVALFLQTLAARLGLVTGKHLAQVGISERTDCCLSPAWLGLILSWPPSCLQACMHSCMSGGGNRWLRLYLLSPPQ